MKLLFTVTSILLTSKSVVGQRFANDYGQHYADHRSRHLQQRGGGFKPNGSSDSTACTVTNGLCSSDGSSNPGAIVSLSYDDSTGRFDGTITTNLCNDHPRVYNGELFGGRTPVDCITQTIPAPNLDDVDGPHAIPLLGRAGMTLSGGVNIYSPFEAGFADCSDDSGQPCACDGASCPAGMDVGSCEKHLEYSCTSEVDTKKFMDTCGGHATPYHIHTDPMCNYETDQETGHSTILGVALDGYGIYGKYESDGSQEPCDLDTCHGHIGMVPVNTEYGVMMTEVYHYHVSDADVYPYTWTLGCYGDPDEPVTLEKCKSLYDGCLTTNNNTFAAYTAEYPDGIDVQLFCPCFESAPIDGCPDTFRSWFDETVAIDDDATTNH